MFELIFESDKLNEIKRRKKGGVDHLSTSETKDAVTLIQKQTLNIVEAEYIKDYKIKIDFNDGLVRIVDFQDFFIKKPHPQYNRYKDIRLFKPFKLEHGNITWGKDWDLIFPLEHLRKGKIIN